jgi:hypothetical protein
MKTACLLLVLSACLALGACAPTESYEKDAVGPEVAAGSFTQIMNLIRARKQPEAVIVLTGPASRIKIDARIVRRLPVYQVNTTALSYPEFQTLKSLLRFPNLLPEPTCLYVAGAKISGSAMGQDNCIKALESIVGIKPPQPIVSPQPSASPTTPPVLPGAQSESVSTESNPLKFKSTAFCLPAIFRALKEANPEKAPWLYSKDGQIELLRHFASAEDDLAQVQDLVKAKTASSAAVLNVWFASLGFPGMAIEIPAGGSAVGTVFDLLVDWKVPGKKQPLGVRFGDRYISYEGVKMKEGFESYIVMVEPQGTQGDAAAEPHDYPLFRLETASVLGWEVYLLELSDGDLLELQKEQSKVVSLVLPDFASKLLASKRIPDLTNKTLHFPQVDLRSNVDISFLEGMRVDRPRGFRIDKTVKQVRLRLDDKGARAESAVAMVSKGMDTTGHYQITRPFLVIFTKSGLNYPAFVALSAPDSWVMVK